MISPNQSFDLTATLHYKVSGPATLLLNIQPAISKGQAIVREKLTLSPAVDHQEFTLSFNDARMIRIDHREASGISIAYTATVSKPTTVNHPDSTPRSSNHFGRDELRYLFPSRYCPSDKIFKLAQNQFGHYDDTYTTVLGITNWIYENIAYTSGATDEHSTALDVLISRQGVCRDFAHLGILFCRALNIPARYITGYAYQLQPPDFHACFEALIGMEWVLFDATRHAPTDGLIRIAYGMDAAETSFANHFGEIAFAGMEVSCQLADDYLR